jgi:hypothetical protein
LTRDKQLRTSPVTNEIRPCLFQAYRNIPSHSSDGYGAESSFNNKNVVTELFSYFEKFLCAGIQMKLANNLAYNGCMRYADDLSITCKRGNAKHSVKDDHAFL